jgi:hypothetical protein
MHVASGYTSNHQIVPIDDLYITPFSYLKKIIPMINDYSIIGCAIEISTAIR